MPGGLGRRAVLVGPNPNGPVERLTAMLLTARWRMLRSRSGQQPTGPVSAGSLPPGTCHPRESSCAAQLGGGAAPHAGAAGDCADASDTPTPPRLSPNVAMRSCPAEAPSVCSTYRTGTASAARKSCSAVAAQRSVGAMASRSSLVW